MHLNKLLRRLPFVSCVSEAARRRRAPTRSLGKATGFLAATLLASGLAGCVSGPYAAKTDRPILEDEGDTPVVLLHKDLRRVLDVGRVLVMSASNKRLSFQAPLRNRTNDETLHLQAQTVFKDDQGRVLYSQTGSEPAWEPLVLTPGQVAYFTQSALTPEATKFVVRVRYAPGHEEDD